MRRVFGYIFSGPSFFVGFLETLVITGICLAILEPLATVAGAPLKDGATVALAGAIIAAMYSGGLYERECLFNRKRTFWRAALIAGPVFALAIATTGFLARNTTVPIYPYRWEWTIALTGVWLFSAMVLRFILHEVHRSGYFARPIVFVGSERDSTALSELAGMSASGFRVAAKFHDETPDPQIGFPRTLIECAAKVGASEIVVGPHERESSLWNELLKCRFSGLRIVRYLDFYEAEGGRVCIEAMKPEWLALSEGFRFRRGSEVARRMADVALALATLVATAPLFLIIAIAVKLQDGGPVLYRQERVGLNGAPFILFKFRSMRMDAERDGPVWAAERDCRITPLGRLIRKIRVDELPQFLNVLLGHMSIVGPRPERPYFVRQFSETIPFYDCRHMVKPGITGWAQVSFRYAASVDDAKTKLSYDLYYVKNRSLGLDLLILFKTIGVVVRADGAR